ncbi:sensor histidine kinase [Zhouia sp. PK063]|uniref:sensor histidine kinase n=1 Tax=Zhouia sp. PK063 TaxID=3373602 RepID=UPI00379332F0
MSLSLVGIIFVQGYWIKTAVADKEEQFSNTVTRVIRSVADKIESRELNDFSNKYFAYVDSLGTPKNGQISSILFINKDKNSNETFIYSHGILEEDYGISNTFFDNNTNGDSAININSYTSKQISQILKKDQIDGKTKLTPIQTIESMGRWTKEASILFASAYRQSSSRIPIHKRVTNREIELLLKRELNDQGIDLDFEYAVESNGLATKIRSKRFNDIDGTRYKSKLFIDNNGDSKYDLLVSFPDKKRFLITSIIGMALLSIVFTLIILIAYSSAIYQLLRQKQISEIKTDFINNMTHEFKTPIATINLALDSLKNPKAFEDSDRVKRYLQMIRDENKRMHAQVENVLRISKLEKNQLDIPKDRVDFHEIIEEALTHVELMVEDRGGIIDLKLDALRSEILGNDFHLTNVIVNILDNANKYSPDAPRILVQTEIVKNSIVLKVKDHGSGMSKAVLKRVFEKFYREHTGNIHNVKGHGLGLAYVKQIIEDHQGTVFAESEKDKGSTFYIKLPLI